MLKEEETIEEGKVKKIEEKKRSSVWRPTGAPGPHWGARTELHIRPVQLAPGGAHGRHLGPVLQKKLSSRI